MFFLYYDHVFFQATLSNQSRRSLHPYIERLIVGCSIFNALSGFLWLSYSF